MYEQYSFSADYQDAILACLIDFPEKFIAYAHILNSAFFTGVERVATARALFAYWGKNSRFPAWEVLGQLVFESISKTSDEKELKRVRDYMDNLREIDTGDVDDVVVHCVGWARRRALWLAIQESALAMEAGDIPEDGFIPKIEKALKVGQNIHDLGYMIGPDKNDIEAIIQEYTRQGFAISSGFPLLDALFPARGFQPGWLISVLAPPKRYKTTFCINMAMNIAKSGRPVFYYPCEITQTDAAIRALCNLTDLSSVAIRKNPKGFTNDAIATARDQLGAPLLIKGYAAKGVSISGEIKAHALTSRQQLGLEPGAIIIDYAETVRSSADPKRTSEHRSQSEIYIEARALGAQMRCPIIMPDRCNRETVEKTVPNMASFQGSFEKAGIVDVGIGLCSTEEEYMQNQLRFFIFLNRHGEANHHFRGSVDPKTQRLGEWVKIPWNPEEEEEGSGGFKKRRHTSRSTRGKKMPSDDEDER